MTSQQDRQMCKPRRASQGRDGGACLREEAHREEEQNPAQTPGEARGLDWAGQGMGIPLGSWMACS